MYVGQYENGIRSGFGLLTCANGDFYDGYFENDMFQRNGTITCSDWTFTGQFNQGNYDGFGK